MDFNLVSGRFTTDEADLLLTKLVRVKTDFHLERIDTVNDSEEDMKRSEKRIKDLEEELRKSLAIIKNYKHIALQAKVTIEFVPDYHNV